MSESYVPWHEETLCVADTETTGTSLHDRVVQVGVVRFERGVPVASWSSLVWAGVEIPEEATKIHGIKTSDVANAPAWYELIPDLARLARGAHPVAYNADFDKRMFMSEMNRFAADLTSISIPIFRPGVRWVDPLVWARSIDRFEKGGNKLVTVCTRRGIALPKAHDAVSDAEAAGKVLWAMRHEIGDMTISELLRQQQVLADAQERRFAAWRARQGIRR